MSKAAALDRGSAARVWCIIRRNVRVDRRGWVSPVTGFFEPVFLLLAIGVGVGHAVGVVTLPDRTTVRYAAFVAPALIAVSAVNGAIEESTFHIYFKMKFARIYRAILATPLTVGNVCCGETLWATFTGAVYASMFLMLIAVARLVPSFWGLLVVPASVLVAFTFASLGLLFTTFARSWQTFDTLQVVLLPMFLFSGTFFPLSRLPTAVQRVAEMLPLWHGVELIRALTLGSVGTTTLLHLLYLLVVGYAAFRWAAARMRHLLHR